MRKLCMLLCVAALCMCCAVPAFADDASSAASSTETVEPTATPEPTPQAVGREDLDGADDIINDAGDALDSVYDYLPDLSPGVLSFMGAVAELLPSWFVLAFCLWLVFCIVLLLLRFLWN